MSVDNGDGTRVIAGRYELRRELGRGGMGVVWAAWDSQLDRDVAVKEVLLPGHLTDDEKVEANARVRREAQSAARIAHPSVITVHDVFDAEGHPWVVMELIRGRSLQEELAERGTLTPAAAAKVAAALLEAVRAAHAAGVVHRDIKPGNVMVCDDSRIVLTDFGIATVEGSSTITRTGTLIGSPEYMSPERLQSEAATPASDLWSVGVTLHTALQGRSPFQRDGITAAIAAVLSAPIPRPDRAGPLAPLINGLLERDPARRLTADAALALLGDLETAGPGPGATGGHPAAQAFSGPAPHTPHPAAPPTPFPGAVTGGHPGRTGHVGAPHPGAGHTAPGPNTPHPSAPGPHTPFPSGPRPAHGAFSGPGPGGGGTVPPWGAAPSPPAPPARPPGDDRRRGSVLIPAMMGVGMLGLVIVVVAVVSLVRMDTTTYERFESDRFNVDYPQGWEVDDTTEAAQTYVYFRRADRDVAIYVNAWDNGPSDPRTSYGWVEFDDNGFREDGEVTEYRTLEMAAVDSGFPADWDVATLEAEFQTGGWTTPARHFTSHIIMIGEEAFAVTMNVPADEAGDHRRMYESVLDSFEPV
ncbi:serine/threonine-protein kinase [Nocardiopsis sediminis]|uniref:non-specific serine/threonine protein kinase n=1 Tax=Nocardiopsis sediminis TaxID=1778267 RepID=A0ABV8FNZ6_9ACTN